MQQQKLLLSAALLCLLPVLLPAQRHHTVQFIEPNIRIQYDSTVFKKEPERQVDGPDNSDRASFLYHGSRVIDVIGQTGSSTYAAGIDSLMLDELKTWLARNAGRQTFVEADTAIRHIGGFSCYGIIKKDKADKTAVCYIIARRYTGHQNMDIRHYSPAASGLREEYSILERFIQCIRFSTL